MSEQRARYERLKNAAEKINNEIAELQGSRREVLRQLREMGLEEGDLDSEIDKLRKQIKQIEEEAEAAMDKLQKSIDAAREILDA